MDTDGINKEYLLLFLRSEAGLKQMERRMTGGLYPAIVQDELDKIRVPLLPVDKQMKTVETCDRVELLPGYAVFSVFR
jgi:restriction endonuclease S subunit